MQTYNKKYRLQNIRLTEEDIEKLDEIGRKVYRSSSRAHTVRLMIEDTWKQMIDDNVMKKLEAENVHK